jgi:alkylation response protein AidB-like acyl-CoA dehydrogenase
VFGNDISALNELLISLRKCCENRVIKLVDAHARDDIQNIHRKIFKELADLGLAGMSVGEEFDGLQSTSLAIAKCIEEIAFCDMGPAIFTSVHNMVAGTIYRFASSGAKTELLKSLSSGELLGAFALTEPSAGSDAAALTTSAKADGSDFIINGEKCYISSANFADIFLVFARTGALGKDGISAFIVPRGANGLSVGPDEKKMGCELSPIATVTLENVRVPAAYLVGELNKGYGVALSCLAGGRVNIAACALGISRKATALAAEHMKSRKQFGESIASFQGLQFMLADMRIRIETSEAIIKEACAAIDNKLSNSVVRTKAAIAKCFATDAAMAVTTDAVQLLGGAGYLTDYKVEKLMRDAKMLQIVEGTNQIQRLLIAREALI